ncbi:MAG: hypothetical protein N3G75_08810 [Methanothrix sp.]|nr:hypothetical protein [Methanothrix sp.]MCX8207909.1 hypothetical protein [Methanothrix sp.]
MKRPLRCIGSSGLQARADVLEDLWTDPGESPSEHLDFSRYYQIS